MNTPTLNSRLLGRAKITYGERRRGSQNKLRQDLEEESDTEQEISNESIDRGSVDQHKTTNIKVKNHNTSNSRSYRRVSSSVDRNEDQEQTEDRSTKRSNANIQTISTRIQHKNSIKTHDDHHQPSVGMIRPHQSNSSSATRSPVLNELKTSRSPNRSSQTKTDVSRRNPPQRARTTAPRGQSGAGEQTKLRSRTITKPLIPSTSFRSSLGPKTLLRRSASSVNLSVPVPQSHHTTKAKARVLQRSTQSQPSLWPTDANLSSVTQDISEIFAVINYDSSPRDRPTPSSSTSREPKRARIDRMNGRRTSDQDRTSPDLSTDCSQSHHPGFSSSLGTPTKRNSIPPSASPSTRSNISGSPNQILSRNLSTDRLSIVPTTLDLGSSQISCMLAGHQGLKRKRTYGIAERTHRRDDQDLKLFLPLSSEKVRMDGIEMTSSQSQIRNGSLKFKARETYSDLRKKWGVDEDEDELEEEQEEDNQRKKLQYDLQAITSQRAIGSSKRFMDELNYLLEGLSEEEQEEESEGKIGLRRLSLIELIKKIKDRKFIEGLKSNGMIEKVYKTLRNRSRTGKVKRLGGKYKNEGGKSKEGRKPTEILVVEEEERSDWILDLTLVILITMFCSIDQKLIEPILRILPTDIKPNNNNNKDNDQEDLSLLRTLSNESDCLILLVEMIELNRFEMIKTSGCSLNKRKNSLLDFEEIIQNSISSNYIPSSSGISFLALYSLSRISSFSARPGLLPQRMINSSGSFKMILKVLIEVWEKIKDEVFHEVFDLEEIEIDQEFRRKIKEQNSKIRMMKMSIEVIENCTVCEEESIKMIINLKIDDNFLYFSTKMMEIIKFLRLLMRFFDQVDFELCSLALDSLIGCLRTLVNLTNYNEDCSRRLIDRPMIIQIICEMIDFSMNSYKDKRREMKDEMKLKEEEEEEIKDEDKEEEEDDDLRIKRKQNDNNNNDSFQEFEEVLFDLMCICLGLLNNLIEHTESGKTILMETYIEEGLGSDEEHNKTNQRIKGIEVILKLINETPFSKPDEKEFIRTSIDILIDLCNKK